jgi:GT2 family glycosyltransferase
MSRRYAYAVTTYNGSKLIETVQSLPTDARVLVLDQSQVDRPLAAAWNYGYHRLVEQEGFDYVITMNDDVVLAPDTGDLLYEAIDIRQYEDARPCRDQMILLVSAYNVRDVNRGTPQDPPKFTSDDFRSDQKRPKHMRQFQARWGTGPDYSCFIFGRTLIQQVGEFDERFPLYFEDNDSHQRIRLSGFEALSYAPYYHYGSGTTNSNPGIQEFVAGKYRASEEYYLRKWGGPPGQERNIAPFKPALVV